MNAKKSVTEFKAANKVGVYFPDDSVAWEDGTGAFFSKRYSRVQDN